MVRAEDQVRAREILRAAGLLATTRRDPGQATALDFSAVQIQPQRQNPWGWRIRVALLVMIAAVALFIVLQRNGRPEVAPPAAPGQQPAAAPAPANEPGVGEDEFRVRIVPAG